MRRKAIAGAATPTPCPSSTRPPRGLSALLFGAGFLLSVAMLPACNELKEEECLKIRGEAYDIVNDAKMENPHTCADDADCDASSWPGCAMPINVKNRDRIAVFKEQFDKGSCKEPEQQCPEPPLMYCKQGLCVKEHKAGEKGNVTPTSADSASAE